MVYLSATSLQLVQVEGVGVVQLAPRAQLGLVGVAAVALQLSHLSSLLCLFPILWRFLLGTRGLVEQVMALMEHLGRLPESDNLQEILLLAIVAIIYSQLREVLGGQPEVVLAGVPPVLLEPPVTSMKT